MFVLRALAVLVVLSFALPAYAYPNSNTALETLATFTNADFKHDLLNPPASNYWIVTPGGNVSYMNLSTNRVLAGAGVSLSLNVLEPCGVILPHSHPRAGKLTYSITSENLFVGFIQENGARTVFNNLTIGQAAYVPRGAIMFFQNLDCKPGMNLFSYNYEDPGLLSLVPNMFRMPDTVLGPAFNADESELDYLHRIIPGYPIGLNNECRKRCGLAPYPTPTPAPASATTASTTAASTASTASTASIRSATTASTAATASTASIRSASTESSHASIRAPAGGPASIGGRTDGGY